MPSFTLVGAWPPVISGSPATSVTVGQAYGFTPTASDPDGRRSRSRSPTCHGRPSPPAPGGCSGTPAAADAGSYSGIVISVSDGTASVSLPSFTLVVQAAANRPPVISGSPATSVTVGQAYRFTPTASDPDGQPLGVHALMGDLHHRHRAVERVARRRQRWQYSGSHVGLGRHRQRLVAELHAGRTRRPRTGRR